MIVPLLVKDTELPLNVVVAPKVNVLLLLKYFHPEIVEVAGKVRALLSVEELVPPALPRTKVEVALRLRVPLLIKPESEEDAKLRVVLVELARLIVPLLITRPMFDQVVEAVLKLMILLFVVEAVEKVNAEEVAKLIVPLLVINYLKSLVILLL